ncbi:MAG: DUF1615 domain-containing protein [Lysobacter sp.]|nr:DUF1615 domain-containing protein [Lysobacter sp.]
MPPARSSNASSRSPRPALARLPHRAAALIVGIALLAGCDGGTSRPSPDETRRTLERLMPRHVKDRADWARDIQAAFAALDLDPSHTNLCAVIAVTDQESNFSPQPKVPGLGKIARKEIETRAERKRVPLFLVRAALQLESPDGRTWDQRIAEVQTEKELSDVYEELIAKVPLGRRLLADANPVRTGGPMQVSIAFAEAHADDRRYPFAHAGSIRHEVFTRRGGMYFGIAHLLDYPASYEKPIHRFADFNAGRYASRNAAFQNAVSVATGIPLDLDGDLVRHRRAKAGDGIGDTERAVRTLAPKLGMEPAQIRRALSNAHRHDFEGSALHARVFEIADKRNGKPLPRAMLPRIRLESPKITRRLTTAWFANRVDARYRDCMARVPR